MTVDEIVADVRSALGLTDDQASSSISIRPPSSLSGAGWRSR